MFLSLKQLALCRFIVAQLLFTSVLFSCGKIGDPIPTDIVFPQVITDLTARAENNTVALKWSMKGRSDRATRIRILRNERDTKVDCPGCFGEYEQLFDGPLSDARFRRVDKESFHYVDGEVRSGKSYNYLILACNDLNYCSEKSNMAETSIQDKD